MPKLLHHSHVGKIAPSTLGRQGPDAFTLPIDKSSLNLSPLAGGCPYALVPRTLGTSTNKPERSVKYLVD